MKRSSSIHAAASADSTGIKPTALRVRLALAADRWFKRVVNGMRTIHQGVWLGLFRVDDFAAANALAYAQWDRYRDENYNRSGLSDWERDAVDRFFPPDSTVLVASAGGGREVLGLAQLGYRVVGFDPSPELVAHGARLIESTGGESDLMLSEPDRVPADLEGPYDAVLVGWGGYIHLRGRPVRVAFLRGLRRLVDRDAPMLLSFFLRSPDDRSFTTTRKVAAAIRGVRRSREPIELGDTVEGTFDHYSTWEEIESELAEGGFVIVESLEAPYPHVLCRAV